MEKVVKKMSPENLYKNVAAVTAVTGDEKKPRKEKSTIGYRLRAFIDKKFIVTIFLISLSYQKCFFYMLIPKKDSLF